MLPTALSLNEIVACARAVHAWNEGLYWRLHAQFIGRGHDCGNPHCDVRTHDEPRILERAMPHKRLRVVWS